MSEHPPIHFEAHRLRHEEASFNDVLAEQIQRAPYLIASLIIHAVIGFAIAGIMLLQTEESETPTIQMVAAPPPPVVEDPPPPPPPDPIQTTDVEPVLVDSTLDTPEDDATLVDAGDIDFTSDAPFDSDSLNNAIGIGGNAGGPSGRPGGGGTPRGSTPTEAAVQNGLQWLRDHQSADGLWDCDDFMYQDIFPDKPASDGAGDSTNDVGVTGLALLAFLGNGQTMGQGIYSDNVRNGVNWLRTVQDMSTGLYGEEVGNPTLYNHAIASMAMGEAYYFSKSPLLKKGLSKATSLILNSQNPYNAWRYGMEPDGANDSSITGWMVFALKTAGDGKIPVPKGAYDGALEWFDTMTDKGTGRTGYAFGNGGGVGGPPSRQKIYLERFPPEKSEALTAVSLLCRIFMTDSKKVKSLKDHQDYELLKKQADLLISKPPVWDEEGGSCDMYYWYYGTFAMNQWGGKHWKNWKKSIEKALIPNQRQEKGNFKGSWDPIGPWGEEGGRVYSTAICTLILEVYYRYSRVLGAR